MSVCCRRPDVIKIKTKSQIRTTAIFFQSISNWFVVVCIFLLRVVIVHHFSWYAVTILCSPTLFFLQFFSPNSHPISSWSRLTYRLLTQCLGLDPRHHLSTIADSLSGDRKSPLFNTRIVSRTIQSKDTFMFTTRRRSFGEAMQIMNKEILLYYRRFRSLCCWCFLLPFFIQLLRYIFNTSFRLLFLLLLIWTGKWFRSDKSLVCQSTYISSRRHLKKCIFYLTHRLCVYISSLSDSFFVALLVIRAVNWKWSNVDTGYYSLLATIPLYFYYIQFVCLLVTGARITTLFAAMMLAPGFSSAFHLIYMSVCLYAHWLWQESKNKMYENQIYDITTNANGNSDDRRIHITSHSFIQFAYEKSFVR